MSALRYEDNVGLIHFQAKQGFKWAHNAGSGLDYEDMFQIASTAFWIAAQGYNPESGHKFSAYFTQVAFSEFRREIGIMTGVKNLNEGQRAEIAARKEENKRRRETGQPELPEVNYGLAPVSFSELTAPGEEDVAMPFEASLASEGMTPEEQVERRQIWERVEAGLSPLARLIVDWLRDPPEALLREITAQHAHANHCNEVGHRAAHGLRDGISIASIGSFLRMIGDVKKSELMVAEGELMRALREIEKDDK